MNLSVGIVGLPNVGKSTLFNALLKKQQALAANYPFATIEPNIGIVPVPDNRLDSLAKIEKEENKIGEYPPIINATVKFVDIAGLVKGASEGEGLGNKFLSHIREVSVIAHAVRAFEDSDVLREGSLDPQSDYETIKTELILADLQTLENVLQNRKVDLVKKVACEKLKAKLDEGVRAYNVDLDFEEAESVKDLFLITMKPEIVVLNVSESTYTEEGIVKRIKEYSALLNIKEEAIIAICAKIESELSMLSSEEQKEYLSDLGLAESGLERLIGIAYQTLNLLSFLTAGEKEVRAWTIRAGSNAVEASGAIHTDFMKKFIKAEVISFSDYVEFKGRKGAREAGRARLEGKDYIVKDGDVVEFKIGS